MTDLANSKSDVNEWVIDKLKTVPVDLSKLNVNDDVIKRTEYYESIAKGNIIDTS